jgi:hypothetical protein
LPRRHALDLIHAAPRCDILHTYKSSKKATAQKRRKALFSRANLHFATETRLGFEGLVLLEPPRACGLKTARSRDEVAFTFFR